ncbi:uncharacterized protein Hap1MRO34_002593 isoform 2-T2 [Clarias gariepinus]
MEIWRGFKGVFCCWGDEKDPEMQSQVEELQAELEKAAREIKECKMREKRIMEERDSLARKLTELESVIASKQKQWERDIKHWETRLELKTFEYNALKTLYDEQRMVAENERESFDKERIELKNRFLQFEASWVREQTYAEQVQSQANSKAVKHDKFEVFLEGLQSHR